MNNSKLNLQTLLKISKLTTMKPKTKITSISWRPSEKSLADEVSKYLFLKDIGFTEYVKRLVKRDAGNRNQQVQRILKEKQKLAAKAA